MKFLLLIVPLIVLAEADRCADYPPVPMNLKDVVSGKWTMLYASEDNNLHCMTSYLANNPFCNSGKIFFKLTKPIPLVIPFLLQQQKPGQYTGIGPNNGDIVSTFRMYTYNVSPDGNSGYYCLMVCDPTGDKATTMNCYAITKADFPAIDQEISNMKVDLAQPMNVVWDSSC